MNRLNSQLEARLTELAMALVDQRRARVIVPAKKPASGFWFGGGNLCQDRDGSLWLVGRYRNAGDSRIGVADGVRGFELAVFKSTDRGASFQKKFALSKADLNRAGQHVLSIEGSALEMTGTEATLYVSCERSGFKYPPGLEAFHKPGTGVWTIDFLTADSMEQLAASDATSVIACRDSRYLHAKDPFLYRPAGGDQMLLYCTHPFCWSSSNTAYVVHRHGETDFSPPTLDFFSRGTTWDVAISRGTCLLDVPKLGSFHDTDVSLMFYDGGEAMRPLDEHETAVVRPRGYSCEELGGVAYLLDGDFSRIYRLSRDLPLLTSPHGTGCSRYVDVLATVDVYYATWQQSQPDRSQPLVMNVISRGDVEQILI